MAACYTDASPTAPTAAQARLLAKKSRKCYTAQEDLCLLREVAATRPFGDDTKWMTVIANVKEAISRELTLRGVKDRIDLLIGYWRQQDARNLKKSGTEEQYSEKEQILQDLSDYDRAINYEPRIIPRSGGSVQNRKRQAATDRTTSVKRSVMDTRAGSTTLVQAAEGDCSASVAAPSQSCVLGEIAKPESPAARLLLSTIGQNPPDTPPPADTAAYGEAEQPETDGREGSPSTGGLQQQQHHDPAGQSHQQTSGSARGPHQSSAGRQLLPVTTTGIRGLQNLGLQLLTMREANEYELRQREIQNENEKIAIEKQKADNETRRIALEERKLDLEERKYQLEVSRHERDNEKLLDSIQKMFNAQRNEMLEFLNGNHT
ncbi:uncharacterized protein LOC144129574 [Amblyomma americanum]